jgi:hypothetical protein
VISVTDNEVTCRLPLDLNREEKSYEVIAFASTYEESNCAIKNKAGEFDCYFNFIAAEDLPKVTGPPSAVFDANTNEYTITITGTGFDDIASKIDFELEGIA